ncbi:uncharacterized protein BCR38DRAFT_351933 [Pseudomassariella vexata]|uniref:SET domain-containing protein n=1 Tax=Pseudomassariella vexata TaxID=1141098 RepID=A0A1Y2DJ29_9PEZI|nr:uncharacterized protein BCR38DRAFT_351933 [Pseudomassariella vexata]ORY59243.1 hypothetical protein BCR38DRAFT_351933 [Pseudomassariella vexata]
MILEAYDDQLDIAEPLWPISTPCARNGTQKYCIYSNPDFADGRGIIFFTSPERAAEVARSSAFTNPAVVRSVPELNAAESPYWRVEYVEGKGMGMIANKNFRIGDHIMSSTPSFMIDYNVFHYVPENQVVQMEADAASTLPANHGAIFMNLSTHDEVDSYETRVAKIILTNSFDIEEKGVVSREDEEEETWYTVFPEISRLNHDCRANADYHFDVTTLTQHIHAVRPIAAGEEITISYVDPILPREVRRKRLETSWHFPCSCSLCMQNEHQTNASDARIWQILELRRQLRDYTPGSAATPAMGELMVSLYEQERLYSSMYEAYTYAALEYNGVGEPWLATKYARLAVQHGLAAGGPEDQDVLVMKELAKDPWSHWSWMLRTRKRMNWGSAVEQ